MSRRFDAGMFSSSNGGTHNPMDKWASWIGHRYAELMEEMIDEVKNMESDDDLVAFAYAAMGQVLTAAGSQFYFDIATGAIHGGEIQQEMFEKGEMLHNIEEARASLHKVVEMIFDQYLLELKETKEDEDDT